MNQDNAFKKMFLVVIQLGAILAVVVMYFHRLNPFSPESDQAEGGDLGSMDQDYHSMYPGGCDGAFINNWMEAHLYNAYVVSFALILFYGVLFIVLGECQSVLGS